MKPRITLAGRPERFIASLIDGLAIFVVPSLLFSMLHITNSAIAAITVFTFNLVYYSGFTAGHWQATPGQRMLGIYVAQLDTTLLDWRAATARFLAYYMPMLPFYTDRLTLDVAQKLFLWLTIVWFAPILVRADRRGVHDLLCGTIVVTGKR